MYDFTPLYPEATSPTQPASVAPPKSDGCPECGTRDNAPHHVGYTGRGYYASYRCDCGHAWWAGWAHEPSVVAL